MRKFSNNKDIDMVVRALLKNQWNYRRGKKHGAIVSPQGLKLSVPGTPSDRRAFYNFKRDVRHIMSRRNEHAG